MVNYDLVLPKEAVFRINLAWCNSLEELEGKLAKNKDHLKSEQNGLLYFSNSEVIDISSTDIRGKIANNQDLDNLIPSPVLNFLQKI